MSACAVFQSLQPAGAEIEKETASPSGSMSLSLSQVYPASVKNLLGLVDVDGVVHVLVLGNDVFFEERAETGDVPDRLARALASDVDVRLPIDRPGQRLAQSRVVEGLGLQVEEQGSGTRRGRYEELVVRVDGEVALLDLGEERLGPVGFARGERSGEGGVVAVRDVVQFGNGEVAAPVVLVRRQGDRLGGPAAEHVGPGADGQSFTGERVGVGIVDVLPDVLGNDRRVQHAGLRGELRVGELQSDRVAVDGRALVVQALRVGELAAQVLVECEDDVVGGEVLAVAPRHAAARDDGELGVGVVPLDGFGQPRRRAEVAGRVHERERLEDDLRVAVLGRRRVPEVRVVGLGGDSAVGLGDREGGAGATGIAVVGAAGRRASGERTDAEGGDRTDGDQRSAELHCFSLDTVFVCGGGGAWTCFAYSRESKLQ